MLIPKSAITLIFPLMFFSKDILASDFDEKSLGKLFTSPAERKIIESTRSGDSESDVIQQIAPSSVNVNGLVIRSKGKNSVWINGNKATGNQTINGIRVLANSASKKNKKIPLVVDGHSVKIKPGQSWSEGTKSVVDRY